MKIKKIIKNLGKYFIESGYSIVYQLYRKKIPVYELEKWFQILPIPQFNSHKKQFIWLFGHLKEYRSLLFCRMKLGPNHPMRRIYRGQDSCHLPVSSRLGEGLVLQHGFSTIINCESIGRDCQIWQNVTVGVSKSGGKKPRIGNNVKICCHAVVLGDIEIGDNVTIGASAVVVKSVPSNCTVVGNPARIISRN